MMCTDEECYNIEINTFGLLKNVSNFTDSKNITKNINDTQPFTTSQVLSDDSEVGLIVLFTFTTVFSIFGNALVVLVFKRGRRSRTDLRPFLINLAIADLIMAIVCMPFTFVYTMLNTWVFSKPMCTIVCFVQLMSVAGSVFTNMAIGIDRFLAVAFPLRSRLTNKRAKYVICVIWICSTGISSLQIYTARGVDQKNGQTTCAEKWDSHEARLTYTVCVFVFTYVIPLLILSITYSIIGILLWKRTTPGNRDHARDMHQLRSKRKVVKMLVIVVAMFGICWLPLHLFTLILDFYPEAAGLVSYETLASLFIGAHWLAMSNSFANPIIYGFTNESFRADLITLFYMWFPCCVCLTRMLPRHSSGSTYETVVFRRQSLYKQAAKISGTYHTRTMRTPRVNKPYLNGHRNRYEYEDIKSVDPNKNLPNGCGQRVLITCDKEYVRLEPLNKHNSVSDCSEASVGVTEASKPCSSSLT